MTYINKAPVIKYVEGGGLHKMGGGASQVLPLQKRRRGGGGGVLAMLKEGGGGDKWFEVVLSWDTCLAMLK